MIPPKTQYRVVSGLLGGALVTSALAFAAPVATAAPAAAPGAKVVVLNDPSFVDTIALADVPTNEGHEAANMIVGLRADGHTVTELTTSTPAAITAALKGKDTLVVPELERDAWAQNIGSASRSAVKSFVRNGGTIVVASDYEDTLNTLFGYKIETTGDDGWTKRAPAGSPFRGGPAALPDNNGSNSAVISTLPAGAVVEYADSDNDNAGVFTKREGKGLVVSLGWDWYWAAPAQADGQDGGWRSILDTSVRTGIKPAVAPSNVFKLPKPAAHSRAAAVKLKLDLPGAGKIKVGPSKKGTLKTVTKKVGSSGHTSVWVKPSGSTIKKLKKKLKASGKSAVATKLRVKATYTPTGGKPRTVTRVYVFKLQR
ncbi:hypothetical protein [Aeromicrobium sp. JJY06]|uniref:hypothetical protein n=1 Tax=Aeromicrobium sp. JJY06 TaxID=3373478 RepID=UPI00376F02D7